MLYIQGVPKIRPFMTRTSILRAESFNEKKVTDVAYWLYITQTCSCRVHLSQRLRELGLYM